MQKYILLLIVCLSSTTAFAVTHQNTPNITNTTIGKTTLKWFEKNFLDQKKFNFFAKHKRQQRKFFFTFKKMASRTKNNIVNRAPRAVSNFIEIRDNEYLVTRAPLNKRDLSRFWSNIIDAKSSLIITLLQPKEGKTVKCFPYWTTKVHIKDWSIEKTKETIIARGIKHTSIVERIFTAKNRITHEYRTIRQLHYTNWLDCHKAPDIHLLLKLVARAGEIAIDASPITVHCTAGRGRSSAFVLLHANRHYIHEGTPKDFLNDMLFAKLQRRGFITKGQFSTFFDIFSRSPTK